MLYKASIDLTFYVIGPEGENELMLQSVLSAYYDAVSLLLRHQVEKRAILENLDLVVLALDETVDNGSVSPSADAENWGQDADPEGLWKESFWKRTRSPSRVASRDQSRTRASTCPTSPSTSRRSCRCG